MVMPRATTRRFDGTESGLTTSQTTLRENTVLPPLAVATMSSAHGPSAEASFVCSPVHSALIASPDRSG